jgi:preprotein translocase subunit SecF
MEFFKIRKDIPFMRHALVFNVISLITFLPRCSSSPPRACTSVEFTGGTVIEVSYAQAADTQTDPRALAWKAGYTDTAGAELRQPRATC